VPDDPDEDEADVEHDDADDAVRSGLNFFFFLLENDVFLLTSTSTVSWWTSPPPPPKEGCVDLLAEDAEDAYED
jgi:hypothetical protein